jgi:serine-type D-Ala-D-Ala carboxypeptidase/endopeptidase (penicillin-binding protein 4)
MSIVTEGVRILHWRGLATLAAAGLILTAPESALGAVTRSAVEPSAALVQASTRSSSPTRSTKSRTGSRSGRNVRAIPASRVAPPLRHSTPRGEEMLARDLANLLTARVKSGTWGAIVVSLGRGDTLFKHNADELLLPASTMKLFTTAFAYERLGPSHVFTTEVLRDGAVTPDGVLQGNLILRGGGDPALSSRFIPGDPSAPMQTLARQIAASGIRRVTGDLVGDASAFESRLVPDGWLNRYLEASYAARVSALSLNENLVYVYIGPGNKAGVVSLQPATSAFKIENGTRVVSGSRDAKVTVRRGQNGTIVVRGWIGSKSPTRGYQLVVDDPPRFAAGALRQALADAGVAVHGEVRTGSAPNGAQRVAALASPPLSELATVMNGESNNHFAELIFRNAARAGDPFHIGSAVSGNLQLRKFMAERVGAPEGSVFAADGSGLSTLDRATARSLAQLLGYAHRAAWSREFHGTLPVAGRSETLRLRMRSTPAMGNLHAKTGTTNEVVSLSGFVTAPNGEPLAFAFLYNGRDRWRARETIDAMGATLAAWER